MEGRLATGLPFIMDEDGSQIDFGDRIEEEVDQMVFGKPIAR
jgi:hypothetical protein